MPSTAKPDLDADIVRLNYHQLTFDLLAATPVLSKAAVKKIRAWERRRRLRLPSSVAEWYSLQSPPLPPTDDECAWFPASLEELLKNLNRQFRGRDRRKTKYVYVGILWQESGVQVPLDGAADPVVGMDEGSYVLRDEGTFSVFVFHQTWDRFFAVNSRTRGFRVEAEEPRFGPMELDYLIERYSEGPRQVCCEGKSELPDPFHPLEIMKVYPDRFYFYSRMARVGVQCQADPTRYEGEAKWAIQAGSRKALLEVLRRLWRVGTLSETLTGKSRGGKMVLKQLRQAHGRGLNRPAERSP